jgi:hypothetical protein
VTVPEAIPDAGDAPLRAIAIDPWSRAVMPVSVPALHGFIARL